MNLTEKQIIRLTKKIDKFNNDYNEYVVASESTELPIIECSIVGYEEFEPIRYEVKRNVVVVKIDGMEYEVRDEFAIEEVEEDIKYCRRRLNKAWRIWKSENPDAELEKDTEEE